MSLQTANLRPNSFLGDSEKPKDSDCFQVFVRVRPLNSRELSLPNAKKKPHILKKQENMIFVFDPDIPGSDCEFRKEKAYVFDQIFDEHDDNLSVYSLGLPLINKSLLSGFNATVFAYGMTGAGKTYTMFGNLSSPELTEKEPGICIYLLQDLFRLINSGEFNSQEFSIKLSYLEIYNEHIRDLLIPSSENLMILEDPGRGVVVPDLSESSIQSVQDLVENIQKGNARRTMASTGMNQFSSRSHAIIQLLVEQKPKTKDTTEEILCSKLSLVDLAGSERAASTENKGIRMTEGAKINRSLLALGNCINILSDPNKSGSFVPYRDSKLTRLLKDSLGGNTKTLMIACITPSSLSYEETVNTLKYASRARHIQRKIVKNVKEVEAHVSQYKEIIESLKNEISSLRNQLKQKEYQNPSSSNQIELLMPETQKICDGDYNNRFEELGKLIYSNLEENWEIKQSLSELKDLKLQNEASLKSCLNTLAEIIEDPGSVARRERITEEIVSINQIMENNEKVQREMEAGLEKNLSEKRTLQGELKKLNQNIVNEQNSRTRDLENLALACKMLRLEKLDLFSQNLELRNTIFQMNEERKTKDVRILELEELIIKLKSESSLKSSRRYENLETMQKINAPSQIYFKIPDKYLNPKETKEVAPVSINLAPTTQNTAHHPEKEKKCDIKIVKPNANKNKKAAEEPKKATVNIEDLKNYAEKLKNINFANVKLKKRRNKHSKRDAYGSPFDAMKEPSSKDFINKDIKEQKDAFVKDSKDFLVRDLQSNEHQFKDSQSKEIQTQLKDIEPKDYQSKENIANEAFLKEPIPKDSLCSSINIQAQETSCENLEDLLRGLDPSLEKKEQRKLTLPTTHTDRITSKAVTESFNELAYPRNVDNQSEKRELSLEKGNKYCIQTLDVAREKVRAFKMQLNSLLNSIGSGDISEKTKQDVKGLIQDFTINRYIVSQNDRSLLAKLQELVLEEEGGDKNRCLSANNHKITAKNKDSIFKELVIEENNEELEEKETKLQASKLKGKINPGHFSKVNKNYAENVGKAQENPHIIPIKTRTKSKERLYADIHAKANNAGNSRHNSKSPMPLLENTNSSKQRIVRKPQDLPKNPSSIVDNEKRPFFSIEFKEDL